MHGGSIELRPGKGRNMEGSSQEKKGFVGRSNKKRGAQKQTRPDKGKANS